jgi:hypothetical protein
MGAVPPVAPALGIKGQRPLARRTLPGMGRDIKLRVEKTAGVAAFARANRQIMAQRLRAFVPRNAESKSGPGERPSLSPDATKWKNGSKPARRTSGLFSKYHARSNKGVGARPRGSP